MDASGRDCDVAAPPLLNGGRRALRRLAAMARQTESDAYRSTGVALLPSGTVAAGGVAVVRVGDASMPLMPSARPELIPWRVASPGSPVGGNSGEVMGARVFY